MSALSPPSLVGSAPRGVPSLAPRTRPRLPRRPVRRAARLQDPAAADLIDIPTEEREEESSGASSSSVDAVVASSPSSPSSSSEQRERLVSSLLALAASTDRGAGGTRRERAAVESLASRLERAPKGNASRENLVGRWSLVYSSAQPFRSSPFFWGFSKAFGSVAAAEAVFAFTDSLPFARVGSARQEVTATGDGAYRITSDVGLTVAGASGRVVTEASATTLIDQNDDGNSPFTLSVRPSSTRVEGSALLRGLGPMAEVVVPVGDALDGVAAFTSRLLGGNSDSTCATELEVTYLDARMRIGRTTRDGHLFLYARDEEF